MTEYRQIIGELQSLANVAKLDTVKSFFKTGKGDYAESDKFMSVSMPAIRKVARRHAGAQMVSVDKLVRNAWHEVRMCGLLILVEKFGKADEWQKERLYRFYLSHTMWINNWDLVDQTAYKIVGQFLIDKPRTIIYSLAESPDMWENRIAIVATYAFIVRNDLNDTFRVALMLLESPHDLINKAVGWMLREAGKRDEPRLVRFIMEHRSHMPRTTLRYAIERLGYERRQELMRRS